jgi:hypothetical protein
MIVIKDVLGKEVADSMYNKMISNTFTWFYFPSSVDYLDGFDINPVFRHAFIIKGKENSDFMDIINPIMLKIAQHFKRDISMVSVYANLLPDSPHKVGIYGSPHVDRKYDDSIKESYTGLYYPHDNDQETILYKEKYSCDGIPEKYTIDSKIKPTKDTLVLWDSKTYHSAPAGTNELRIGINFNFYL